MKYVITLVIALLSSNAIAFNVDDQIQLMILLDDQQHCCCDESISSEEQRKLDKYYVQKKKESEEHNKEFAKRMERIFPLNKPAKSK